MTYLLICNNLAFHWNSRHARNVHFNEAKISHWKISNMSRASSVLQPLIKCSNFNVTLHNQLSKRCYKVYLILRRPLCSSAFGPTKISPSRAPAITRTCFGLPTLKYKLSIIILSTKQPKPRKHNGKQLKKHLHCHDIYSVWFIHCMVLQYPRHYIEVKAFIKQML